MKINELKPGGHIELKAEIKSIQPIRKLWKCFECDTKGLWKKEEEMKDVCPNCGAHESDKPKVGVWIQELTSALIKDETGMTYLDLWHEDAHGHIRKEIVDGKETDKLIPWQIGDKIHLINGYARENSSKGVNVSAGKFGTLRKVEE